MRRLLAGTLAACFGVGCQQPACKCQEPRSPNAVAAGAAPSSAPLTVAPAPPSPAPPPPPGPSAEPLPEVIVKNIGLHIGGGPNDEASKAPFVRAIEARFDELRACYRKIGEPGKGGVFGTAAFRPS